MTGVTAPDISDIEESDLASRQSRRNERKPSRRPFGEPASVDSHNLLRDLTRRRRAAAIGASLLGPIPHCLDLLLEDRHEPIDEPVEAVLFEDRSAQMGSHFGAAARFEGE